MSLNRFVYEPFYSLSDFDRLFDEAFSSRSGGGERSQQLQRAPSSLRPKLDVHEDDKQNIVTATFELPGLKKEDININVHDNVLTVSGETKTSVEHEEGGYAVRERRFGKFSRSITLPQGVQEGQIKAALNDGVLTVTFPKTTPEQTPKKITIS